jgi:hypothetical protein
VLRGGHPQTRTAVTPAGGSAQGRLDYLFFRLPPRWASEVRKLQDRIGSDHAPLVGAIRFAPPVAPEPDYLAGRDAVTVSGARSRMLSEEAPTPMSNTPGSTADPIEPP